MTKQRFLLLLILIMFMTPVISVSSHYFTMVSFASAEDTIDNTTSNSEPCQHHNKFKLTCNTTSLCSFSMCAYGNISLAFLLLTHFYNNSRYKSIKKIFPYSFSAPPEIKPPIYNL